jgi:hypothetical protein
MAGPTQQRREGQGDGGRHVFRVRRRVSQVSRRREAADECSWSVRYWAVTRCTMLRAAPPYEPQRCAPLRTSLTILVEPQDSSRAAHRRVTGAAGHGARCPVRPLVMTRQAT